MVLEKRGIIFLWGFIIASILVSFYFDSQIVEGVSHLRNFFLDDFFLGLTFLSSEVILFFFLTSLFLFRGGKEKRKWILPLWFTLALSVVVSFILKFSIQRPRPFQLGIVSVLPVLEKASHLIWNFSFPSFQAMLAFCAIPILSKEFPRLKYFWIIFATLVAFSRVYFGVHFLSDVIAGGAIGYLLGWVVIKTEKNNRFFERIYLKIFRK